MKTLQARLGSLTRAGVMLLAFMFASFSPAAILEVNSYTDPIGTGPVNALLDGDAYIGICYQFFNVTPVPSGPLSGTVSAVNFSTGGPLSVLNNYIAAATFQMLIQAYAPYSYLPGGSSPRAPMDVDGITAGQHVVWMAGSSPGFIPNPGAAFGTFSGTALDWYNIGVAHFSDPSNAAAYAATAFAQNLVWFHPDNKAQQSFLLIRQPGDSHVPEPGTYGMLGAGLVMCGGFIRRRSSNRS